MSRQEVEEWLVKNAPRYATFEQVPGVQKGIILRNQGAESFRPLGHTWKTVYRRLVEEAEEAGGKQHLDGLQLGKGTIGVPGKRPRHGWNAVARRIINVLDRLDALKEADLDELTERVAKELEK